MIDSGTGTIDLCLNGHSIEMKQKDGKSKCTVEVKDGAMLNLYDEHTGDDTGSITHAANHQGTGVYVVGGGEFTMYNGCVSGNSPSGVIIAPAKGTRTGDENNIVFWIALMTAALAGMTGMTIRTIRRRG